jgi:phosphatidylglycerophosphatase A
MALNAMNKGAVQPAGRPDRLPTGLLPRMKKPISRSLRQASLFIVTCGFVGYLPFAPGTFAAAVGSVLLYLFPGLFLNPIFVAGLVVFSVLCINNLEFKDKDPGYVVIDELAGMCVAMVGHRATVIWTVSGFLLFRFFDIIKPSPIRNVERLKKGYGIVADDVMAGAFANVALWVGYALYTSAGRA